MKYENIEEAIFLRRPNRFVAYIALKGQESICHVKNTGRCRELLIPGTTVYVQRSNNLARKTPYDLIAVRKGPRLINMDSQAPNKAALEWLAAGKLQNFTLIKPETTYGNSRFDFYLETKRTKSFLEVKGVTLEEDGVVLFPDAPTDRGIKHIHELIACRKEGYKAYLLFVIQMEGVKYFSPNSQTQPEFATALLEAQAAGVKLLAYDCHITPDTMIILNKVKIILKP